METLNEFHPLTYLKWQDWYHKVKPYQALMEVPKGIPRGNLEFEEGPLELIEDIRGRENEFTLDNNGFTVRRHHFRPEEWDQKTIEDVYLKEVEELIRREIPGADKIVCFNWQIRTADKNKTDKNVGDFVYLDDSMQWIKPVSYVHVDQTPGATEKRVRFHMGVEADSLLENRYRIINVWRPMRHTIEDQPLAVGDGSRLPLQNCVGVDHIRREYIGESNYPLYSPGYKWYYLNRQTRDEVMIFKTHDSSTNVRAMCCPHTSFRHSSVNHVAFPRESVEVRALVFSSK